MRSAKQHHSLGVLAIQAAAVLIGVGLLYGAYSTATKGLQVAGSKRVEGGAAWALAAVLAGLGIGLAVAGVLLGPALGP